MTDELLAALNERFYTRLSELGITPPIGPVKKGLDDTASPY